MQVEVRETTYHKVNIPDHEILEHAIKVVGREAGVEGCRLNEDGKLTHEVVTSHRYDEEIGDPSEAQSEALALIDSLRECIRRIKK